MLPEYGKKVLAAYKNRLGNWRRVCATYIPRYTEVSWPDNEYAYDEYYEEKDEYFTREGWYEQIDNWDELTSVHINEGKVTHWMPLPEPPND